MQTKYRIIRAFADRTEIEEREVDLPERPTYRQILALLSPIFDEQRAKSHFEHVTVLGFENQRTDMFVDEEGQLYKLPFNPDATAIYHRASVSRGEQHIGGIIEGAPVIYGTAVYFYRQIWF